MSWSAGWKGFGRLSIPAVPAAALCAASAGMMACGAWWFGLRESVEPARPSAAPSAEFAAAQQAMHAGFRTYQNSNSQMHVRGALEEPLPKGALLPPIEASGWLNGAPDADAIAGKVRVIDAWDGVCTVCGFTRPVLAGVQRKYRDRGVVFLGVTSAVLDEARGYVDDAHLSWPNACGAGASIDALRATAPTIFVVGVDGRVAWNDGRARYRHDFERLGERLEAAIEAALEGGQSGSPNPSP